MSKLLKLQKDSLGYMPLLLCDEIRWSLLKKTLKESVDEWVTTTHWVSGAERQVSTLSCQLRISDTDSYVTDCTTSGR